MKGPAVLPSRPAVAAPPAGPGGERRELWLKAGILFCGALLAGIVLAFFAGDGDGTPAPRVERAPAHDGVLYEDQYVRVWDEPPGKTTEPSTETSP